MRDEKANAVGEIAVSSLEDLTEIIDEGNYFKKQIFYVD